MPVSYGSEEVLCPFYDEETRNTLKCEGVFSKTCNQNFLTSVQKKNHKAKYCNKDYFSCPHFKQVNNKYI